MKPASLATCAALLAVACAPAPPPVVAPAPAPPPVVAPAPMVKIATSAPAADPPEPESAPPPAVHVAAAEPEVLGPEAARDERRYLATPRAPVVFKLQGLESLFATTPAAAPDRHLLMRRLAEGYVELAWVAQREASGEKAVKQGHARAIQLYEDLHAQYPKACTAPNTADPRRSTGCDDEVLYRLGLEAERAGDLDRARKALLQLLQSHPGSRYTAAAYVAFGEMFLKDAAADPSKLPLAEQSYAEAIKYPSESRVHGFARFRLAEVQARKGDDPQALSNLVQAATWAAAHPDDTGLAAAVRREAVEVYARSGDPRKARAFFSRMASGAELEQVLAELDKRRASP